MRYITGSRIRTFGDDIGAVTAAVPEANVEVTPKQGSVLSFQNVDENGAPHPKGKHLVKRHRRGVRVCTCHRVGRSTSHALERAQREIDAAEPEGLLAEAGAVARQAEVSGLGVDAALCVVVGIAMLSPVLDDRA